ncbi:MAG: prolyl oligopeptidase family serine peptidase [Pseudomonadota bacterium]
MKKIIFCLLGFLFFGSLHSVSANKSITLETIMSHPDWIGRAPVNGHWSYDNQAILFWQKREGSQLQDLFLFDVTKNTTNKIPLNDWHLYGVKGAVKDSANQFQAYIFDTNIFLRNLKNGKIRQLTKTEKRKSQLLFGTDNQLYFRQEQSIFSIDLKSGLITLEVSVVLAESPDKEEKSTFLTAQQSRLFDYIELQKTNRKASKDQENRIANTTEYGIRSPFYLGKGKALSHLSLSPNGQWAIASTYKENNQQKRDTMPKFVTQDGYVENVDLRHKVGEGDTVEHEIWLLDIKNQKGFSLDKSELPDYSKDPLKKIRRASKSTVKFKRQSAIYDWFGFVPIRWSRNGENVAFMLFSMDNKDRWLVGVDFKDKTLKTYDHLHDKAWVNDFAFNDFGWLPDNRLYYLSEKSGYSHLYLVNESGRKRQLTKGDFEISQVFVGERTQSFYFIANQEHPGIYEVYRTDFDGKNFKRLTTAGGVNGKFSLSSDESQLLLSHSELLRHNELFLQTVVAPKTRKQITQTVSDKFKSIPWTQPDIITIESPHSKLPIYGRLYKPKGKDLKKAVMFVHGAGYLQNVHYGWSGYFREFMFHSLLTKAGYTVLDLDYRASKGYGRDWRTAIYRQMGTPELEDYVVGANWLMDQFGIDPKKIGIYGGSYGGFMTFMAMFKEPDVFAAGASLRPVTDWAHYNQGYTSNILNTPEVDPEAFNKSSPIEFAQGLQGPLLICHGMVDDNVVFQDSVRLVQRLIELKKEDFELAVYPVEPHGFVQPTSWLDEYRRIFKLFEQNL